MIILAALLSCECKCDGDAPTCASAGLVESGDREPSEALVALVGSWEMTDCDGERHTLDVMAVDENSLHYVQSSTTEMDACEDEIARGAVTVYYDGEQYAFEGFVLPAGAGVRGTLGEGYGYLTLTAMGPDVAVSRSSCDYQDVNRVE